MRWLWLESPPYHYRLSAWTEFRMTWWCKTCRRLFEISTSNITFWHKTGNYNVKYLRLVQDIGDVNISKMCKWQFLWYLAGELIRFIRHKNLLIFTAGHVSQDKYFPTWHIKHKSILRPSSSPCLQEGRWGEGGGGRRLPIFTEGARGGLGRVFMKVFVNCLGYKLLSFITSQLSFVSNVCVFPDVYYYQVEIKIQTFHSEPIFPTIN